MKTLKFMGYSFEGKDFLEEESEIKRATKELKKYAARFRELEKNPRGFFSDESRIREVYEISNKMKNFYQKLVDEEYSKEMQNSDD